MAPREGERRLSSAITFTRPGRASAAANGRTGGASRRGALQRRRAAGGAARRPRARVSLEDGVEHRPARPPALTRAPRARGRAGPGRGRRRSRRPRGRTPSRRFAARPATTSAAAALSSTTSRFGPLAPASSSRAIAAFACGSPPRSASTGARDEPGVLGRDGEAADLAAVQLGDRRRRRRASARRGRRRAPPRPARPQPVQAARDERGELGPRHADHLPVRAGRGW